jgi:hypothetical protein
LKFLIDECLHTSLVQVAHASGYVADHVNYLSLGGLKDWQLLPVIREREYTFVTNNGADFLALFGKEPLHPGIIIRMSPPFFSENSSRPLLDTLARGI